MSRKKTDLTRNLPTSSFLNMLPPMIDDTKVDHLNIFRTYVVSDEIKNNQFAFTYYTVVKDDFLDLISNDFYQTPYLWWVIAIFNDIQNPYEHLNENMVLKILKYQYLYLLFDNMTFIGNL